MHVRGGVASAIAVMLISSIFCHRDASMYTENILLQLQLEW